MQITSVKRTIAFHHNGAVITAPFSVAVHVPDDLAENSAFKHAYDSHEIVVHGALPVVPAADTAETQEKLKEQAPEPMTRSEKLAYAKDVLGLDVKGNISGAKLDEEIAEAEKKIADAKAAADTAKAQE